MKKANVTELPEEPPVATEPIPMTDAPSQALTVAPSLPVGQVQQQPEAPKPKVTAAQAKVEAVASLTMKAYERAATLELSDREREILAREFPDEAFKPGAAGKEHLIYIEHAFLRERFNEAFGMGKWALVPRSRWEEPFTTQARPGKPATDGSRVYVEAMLVIRGCFVAEAIGEMEYYPKNAAQNYGDAVEGAKTAAFRRCAKEFGVGLQAWKKDFGDGWWKRYRERLSQGRESGRKTSQEPAGRAGGSQGTAPPPQSSAQGAAQRAPAANKPASAPAGTKMEGPRYPTQASREWMIQKLNKDFEPGGVADYFRALPGSEGILLPTEGLESLPLQFCPVTVQQYDLLVAALKDWFDGDPAVMAYPPNPLGPGQGPLTKQVEKVVQRATGGQPAPGELKAPASVEVARAKDPEWFWDVFCPIPHKGETKAEYERNPERIRDLYDAMKGGDENARKRLWGFARNWTPKARTVGDRTYQPSEGDLTFRRALDDFLDWEAKHGKDTNQGPGSPAGLADHEPGAGEPQDGPDGEDGNPFNE